jgi:hypothetical protein
MDYFARGSGDEYTMTSRLVTPGLRAATPPRGPKPARRLLKLTALATLAAMFWLGAAVLYRDTRPSFGPATLLLQNHASQTFTYPFQWSDPPRTTFVLVQQFQLPRFYPTTFVFYPQDFLWAVSVNGHDIHAAGLPLAAASHEGRSIDLAPWLHSGLNTVTLQMEARWQEASLRLAVSPWDFYRLVLLALVACATGATALLIATFFDVRLLQPEPVILLAGVGLRYIYVLGTPYFVRSFDYWGHAAYLDYVTQHLRLPPPNANWEAFQAPLYYLLVGGITHVSFFLGMTEDQRYVLWQTLSLLFSFGLLAVGYAIAAILYERNDRRRFYMLAVLAVAPPLVFNAARIGNDGMLALLSFTWLALMLRYWHRPSRAGLIGLAIALGFALLTKANAISLVFITALCLLCDRRVTAKSGMTSLGLTLAICGFIAGWYYVPRALHSGEIDTYVVGNLRSLNHRARIDHVFIKSLIFNPFKIVRYPFAEIWGPRNDYFLEVFFKTMLLGEWIKGAAYKWLGRWMVLVAIALIPSFAFGLWQSVKRRATGEEPLFAALAGVLIAQWLFLQLAPYLSTQDFRFSVILLVPLVYFFLGGIRASSDRLKAAATFLLQVALLNSAIYLAVLAM